MDLEDELLADEIRAVLIQVAPLCSSSLQSCCWLQGSHCSKYILEKYESIMVIIQWCGEHEAVLQ